MTAPAQLMGPLVRFSGIYRNTKAWVRVSGVWTAADTYVRVNGVWTEMNPLVNTPYP